MLECYEELKAFVGERIYVLRKHKKMSARKLSLSLGCGKGYINNIENKKNMPSMEFLYYICEYFKITLEEFFAEKVKAPAVTSELINEIKNMNEESQEYLLSFIKSMKK